MQPHGQLDGVVVPGGLLMPIFEVDSLTPREIVFEWKELIKFYMVAISLDRRNLRSSSL